MNLWLLSFVATIASTSSVVVLLKQTLRIPRPKNALIKLSDNAFPSGHTSIAFALATFFILFVLNLNITNPERLLLMVGFVAAACAVAWWRLELRVHTIGQVGAGAIVGVLLALLVYVLLHL